MIIHLLFHAFVFKKGLTRLQRLFLSIINGDLNILLLLSCYNTNIEYSYLNEITVSFSISGKFRINFCVNFFYHSVVLIPKYSVC